MGYKNRSSKLVCFQYQYRVGVNLLVIPFLVQSRASSISSKVRHGNPLQEDFTLYSTHVRNQL